MPNDTATTLLLTQNTVGLCYNRVLFWIFSLNSQQNSYVYLLQASSGNNTKHNKKPKNQILYFGSGIPSFILRLSLVPMSTYS
jgi:hypothetical protein